MATTRLARPELKLGGPREKDMSHDIFGAPAEGIPKTLTDPDRK
jgi:hypothetical protein